MSTETDKTKERPLIGLHSYSRRTAFAQEDGYGIHRFLDEAAAWGFQACEIITGKAGEVSPHIGSEEPGHLQAICTAAAERGLPVACWSTYNDFAFTPNETWRQDNITYIERWIDLAAATGVPNLRFLTGYRVQGQADATLEELVVAATRRCARAAEAAGVNLALENHNTLFLYAADIARLRSLVDSSRLTTCPDPSNGFPVLKEGFDPQLLEDMYANLAALAPLATNAHLKVADAALRPFDPERLIRILREAGFTGAIQFEAVGAAVTDPAILPAARQRLQAAIDAVYAEVQV
ncbi:MAG: sugar phosphate isomerase/epimerase family protein [Planctomycetota bacterium]